MPVIDPSTIPSDRPVSIIIRHAERFNITSMKKALDVLLTEKGKEDARNLGKSLLIQKPVMCYHSPVTRCGETAENIIHGLREQGRSAEMGGVEMKLGGPYIKGDWKKISEMVGDMGQEEFIRKWFSGSFPENMILSLEDAAHQQLEILANQLNNNQSSTINISHDWNILILRTRYFNLSLNDMGMPDFMEGMVYYMDDSGKPVLQFGEKKYYPGQ